GNIALRAFKAPHAPEWHVVAVPERSRNTGMDESGERKVRPIFPIAATSTPTSGGSTLAHLSTHFATDAFSPGHVLIWINKLRRYRHRYSKVTPPTADRKEVILGATFSFGPSLVGEH